MNRQVKQWAQEKDPIKQRHILQTHGDKGVLWLARNPHLDPEILVDLLDRALGDCPESVHVFLLREALAQNPSCPEPVADALLVGIPVVDAQRSDLPEAALRHLALSGSSAVRRNVAGNPNCPADVLRDLATDFDPTVRSAVATNPSAPTAALKAVLEAIDDNDTNPDLTLMALATHAHADAEILDMVMLFGAEDVERAAQHNPRNRYVEAMIEVVVQATYERYRFALDCGADPMTAAAAAIRAVGRRG